MTFEEILQQTVAILQSRGRVSYRALQREFELDDTYLADLKDELLYAYLQVIEDEGLGLAWTRETAEASASVPVSPLADPASGRAPHAYTPSCLAEKILTSRSALEGERKQVTVLFADIKDSTELIQDLDPEEARKLFDPAIHIMIAAVHRFEGTVNQVLGDGVMSIFGAPIAHEDHAARACYSDGVCDMRQVEEST
jgi:hypothetical protein